MKISQSFYMKKPICCTTIVWHSSKTTNTALVAIWEEQRVLLSQKSYLSSSSNTDSSIKTQISTSSTPKTKISQSIHMKNQLVVQQLSDTAQKPQIQH